MNTSDPFDTFDDWNKLTGTDSFGEPVEAQPEACLVCEAMCPDAVDGTLSDAERRAFEQHVAGCAHCAQELEDAQRGAAWLGLLKSQTPEPPATLLSRILAETTGARAGSAMPLRDGQSSLVEASLPSEASSGAVMGKSLHPAEFPGFQRPAPAAATPAAPDAAPPIVKQPAKVLPFRTVVQRFAGWQSRSSYLQPRLAMTAAMAFFSIALTLNLTGVRLRDLRVDDLRPAALERSAAAMQASAVRSFQNLRVVYQVESRVSELRQDSLWDDQAGAEQNSTAKRAAKDKTGAESNGN